MLCRWLKTRRRQHLIAAEVLPTAAERVTYGGREVLPTAAERPGGGNYLRRQKFFRYISDCVGVGSV